MKKKDIKRHLKDYQIFSRTSTISHAFASALSIADIYDDEVIDAALKILGQDPENDLLCAYCDKPAETWDHVKAIVNKGQYSGNGHQVNNLLPCCKSCNSSKGNKNWDTFLRQKGWDTNDRMQRIEKYVSYNFLDATNLLKSDEFKDDLGRMDEIKNEIFSLFKKGDEQAKKIRDKLRHLKSKNQSKNPVPGTK